MNKCPVCGKSCVNKYCSNAHEKKAWKLRNREKYLLGKLKYRRTHKEQIKSYKKMYQEVKNAN